MSEATQRADITKKTVVYRLPGMDSVTIRSGVEYRSAEAATLTLDVYYPPEVGTGARLPAVVIVAGYPDPGFQKMLGCRFKEMGSSTSWCRLLAASGLAAVAYSNLEPATDVHAVLDYLRGNAAGLGIDENRIGLWASSGNVPLALSVLMDPRNQNLKCAALCYGLTLDLDGFTWVAEGARLFGFANPAAGKTVDDLPANTPLFVARAGQDQFAHLNETLDRFVAKALARNLP
jgi:hypothetical protein